MRYFRHLLVLSLLTSLAHAQLPPLDYETTGRQLRQSIASAFHMHATGSDWASRKQIADILDFVFAPLQVPQTGIVTYHPFLFPEIACFTRSFYLESIDLMLAAMDAAQPQASGVRTYYLNSSAVIVEAFFPNGPGGALRPFRVAIDFADVVFDTSQYFDGGCIAEADYIQRVGAIADRIDFQFVTHSHPDHVSRYLTAAMQARGKPTFVPPYIVSFMLLLGVPTNNVVAITTGEFTLDSWFSCSVFSGAQLGLPNNVYFLDFNVPVTPGSSNDGVTFCHFGDNDILGPMETHIQALVSSGFLKDHVLTANCSSLTPSILALLQPSVRYLSPCYEFYHFVGGGFFGLSMPEEGQVVPSNRMPHFWGESSHFPSDFGN